MLRTVRARTTMTAVAVMSAAVAIASFALVILLQRSLLRDVDARAAVRLHDLVALAVRDQVPRLLAGDDEDSTVAQLVADNEIVAQSPAIRGGVVIADFAPAGSSIVTRYVSNAPIVGGGTYRVAAQRVTAPSGPAVAYAGASVEPVTDSIHSVEVLLAVVGPALILLTGGMTWWLVGRTLDPVEAIRAEVAEISAAGLARRVPERDTGDEIQRLAQTMNSMLARLDDATSRQRQFVSDAAHELRSPVAAIRAELDLATAHPDDVDWPALLDRLTTSSTRLERLVKDLFVLATADEQSSQRPTEVDLDELVLRDVESLRATSGHAVEARKVDAARVLGDRDQLERVVANLLDNAERHTTSTIVVELRSADAIAELTVADDGPGIPSPLRERVFERFTRLDEARDRDQGGAGLGLAIARQIVTDHGGSIELADSNGGARFVIRLPTAPMTEAGRFVRSHQHGKSQPAGNQAGPVPSGPQRLDDP
jgi:signal transduction histidine kinase